MDELPLVKLLPADGRDVSGATHFGGMPTFIQNHRVPECCGHPMSLLAQLDSLDYREADLPDSALVYVFICRSCFDVQADMQCM